MKRLLLLVTMLSSFSLFAAPWDLKNYAPQEQRWVKPPKKVVYTDLYVTLYMSYDLQPHTYYHKVRVDVEFNQSVGVPYYAVIRVYGDFVNGDWYRDYTLTLTSSQWRKSQEFSLLWNDEIYTEITELVEYGPQ